MGKVHTREELVRAAAGFVRDLTPRAERATVVGLYGDLGSGKTTFVQAGAKALGVTETVVSPTFLIFKTYQLPHTAGESDTSKRLTLRCRPDYSARERRVFHSCAPFAKRIYYKRLVHVDAYRLKSAEELRRLHFHELLRDPENLIFIEWADLVSDILPEDHLKIFFEFVDDSTRRIAFPSPRSES